MVYYICTRVITVPNIIERLWVVHVAIKICKSKQHRFMRSNLNKIRFYWKDTKFYDCYYGLPSKVIHFLLP